MERELELAILKRNNDDMRILLSAALNALRHAHRYPTGRDFQEATERLQETIGERLGE